MEAMKPAIVRLALLTAALAPLACGAKNNSTPTSPTLSPVVTTTTITITSNGVTPNNIEVALGARILFINNDSRSHNMTSDPHPEHTDCTALNQIGFLAAGAQRESGNLTTARVCNFHDHDDPDKATLKGRITVK
jgi:plastocyanin